MKLLPAFDDFERAWAQGKNQLVYTRLAADLAQQNLALSEAGPKRR